MNILSLLKTSFVKFIAAPIITILSMVGHNVQPQNINFGSTYPTAGTTYTLAGSGISSSATSITLTSLTLPQTGYKIQDSDVSSTFYLTIESGNTTKQEIISCTTISQNANGTATLSGCARGLLPITPYTASSTYAFAHAGGSSVIFSNAPQFYNQFAALDMAESISNTWTFSSATPPKYDINPNFNSLASTTIATIGYVASTSYSGTVDASTTVKGIGEIATAAEIDSGTLNGSTGAPLIMNPNFFASSTLGSNIPTSNQKAALAGQSGTGASSTNKFEDYNDTSTTSLADKLIRSNSSGLLDRSFLGLSTHYQLFIASSTWTKPSSATGSDIVFVQLWGAGGGGGNGGGAGSNVGGGGGGAYTEAWFRASDLSATATVTIGTGGAGGGAGASGTAGGNTTFGSYLTAYGGAGGLGNNGTTGGTGGSLGNLSGIAGFSGGTAGANSGFGGAGGGSASQTGGSSVYGGAGGGGSDGTNHAGGTGIIYGGNGGAGDASNPVNGTAPGGGGGGKGSNTGGNAGSGARGEARIWVFMTGN